MITAPDLNPFALKEKIEEMIVYENITMKDIYEIYKNFLEQKEIEKVDELKISFFKYGLELFSFQIGDIFGYDIQTNPIEIKINEQKIYIICQRQIEFIKYKYKVDTIICQDENGKSYDFDIYGLTSHRGHKIKICSKDKYSVFANQNEISKFLKKYSSDFIGVVFNSPQDFEKNYRYYFNINDKYLDNKYFTIFEDLKTKRRYYLAQKINNWEFGICYNFYGSSGQGKSITLIGALKYGKKFPNLGTLYINCKTLRVLFRQSKTKKLKQILIDEIVFLLRNKHNDYLNCCRIVKDFLFLNEYDFWDLIEKILEYINKINDYYFIIAFDQYNNENDIHEKLNQIKLKYLVSKKFRIIVFSSMNEKDIRKIKMSSLFHQDSENDDEMNKIEEIENICSNFYQDFNKKEKEIFQLFGETMKYYYKIKNRKNSTAISLDNFLNEKKEKIKFKILCFYKKVEEKKALYYNKIFEININDYIGKILSFNPNEEYTKDKLMDIIDNVPFRFFNIKQENEIYIIQYSCPIIEQIFIDIYKTFLLKNSFKTIKDITKGSGAFGCIFEYAVIFYIIEKSKTDNNNIFNYFNISRNLKVKKFVLNKNEKFENLIFEKQELDVKYDYIIEQEAFCGKTLDFLLIHFIDDEPYVYGFQVSIYKKKIYDINELEDAYETMFVLLKHYFDKPFKKENLFFGYIFDHEYKGTDRYDDMLEKCDKNVLKYCFYEPYKQQFLDKNDNEIKNIGDISSKVFTGDIPQNNNLNNIIFYPLSINYPEIDLKLNDNQFQRVTKLLKKKFNPKSDWKIIKKSNQKEFFRSYNNGKKYFYICYDDPYFKLVVFFDGPKIYKLLLDGEIEEDFIINTKLDIYICQIIAG